MAAAPSPESAKPRSFESLGRYNDRMASDLERAWVAGIMDGDGCITLSLGANKYRRPLVVVDNTDREILAELQRLYGGALVAKRLTREHHRQCWSWRIYGSTKIIAFLAEIVPYMHCDIKVQRARMLLDEWKKTVPRNGFYTPDTALVRAEFDRRFMSIGAGRGSQGGHIYHP